MTGAPGAGLGPAFRYAARRLGFAATAAITLGIATSVPADAQSRAAAPAKGRYTCQAWMGSSYVNFGSVTLAGGSLAPNPIAKVGGNVTGITQTKDGIVISYTTARGYRESMDCKRA